ncbi:reverse transcriptase domain-containing protein [Tanacetum coccineum]|uniref:Reverse transcriptase domain-containing protein n=1 Tax=Tanacetum coccineum TaxID=301880 RepID=A0ABQ5FM65_9ASTR
MSTRSTSSNLFSPLRDPESLIRRRNFGEPSSLFNFEEVMSISHNNQGPPPAGPLPPNNNGPPPLVRPNEQAPQSMEELCQPSINGRGGPIASIPIQATDFRLRHHMIQQQNRVSDDALRLSLFPYSLTHHAIACNIIANPRGDVKAITTRSGFAYDGTTIPPTPSPLSKEVEREAKTTKDKFLQIFQILRFDISFTDVVLHMPKFASTFKSLLIDYDVDPRVLLILGRPFLRTERSLIDVYGKELTLRVDDEAITFKVGQTYELLPTLLADSPFDEEYDLNKLSYYMKPLIEEPPELELKDLPSHLEYAFLEGTDKLPVIISKELKDDEKAALLKYQLRFHGIKDAKSLWAAIKSRFGGNVESKKMQKNVLKQQFENFSVSDTEGLDKAYDRSSWCTLFLMKMQIKKFLRALPSSWNNVALNNKEQILEFKVKDKSNAVTRLKNQLDESLREKDYLKAKLEQLETSSKNLNKLINSQLSSKDKTSQYGDQLNENDSSGSELFNSVFDSRSSDGDDNQTNDRVESVRPSGVIIEDWVSDDEDIFQSNDLQATNKPSFKRIEFTNADDTVKPKQMKNLWINHVQNPKGNPQQALKNKGIFDSGCSRHMTGNKDFLLTIKTLMEVLFCFWWNSRCFAERKNRTLIEAARTMLADSLLPTVFWAEAVNTACYVLNRVLVTKPYNKTPYELIIGRTTKRLKKSVDARQSKEKNVSTQQYIVFPLWSSISSSYKSSDETYKNDTADDAAGETPVQKPYNKELLQGKATKASSTNSFNIVSTPVNAASAPITSNDARPSFVSLGGSFPLNVNDLIDDPLMPDFWEKLLKFKYWQADFNNMEPSTVVSPIPTTRVHSIHPKDQIIRDPKSAVQTGGMTKKSSGEHAMISYIQNQRRSNHKDFQNCLLSCSSVASAGTHKDSSSP